MVHLNRIYTKGGDTGVTSLGDGSRVAKTDPRIAAYGGTDELNSVVGVAIAAGLDAETSQRLRAVQNDLFDLGADLCVPLQDPTAGSPTPTPAPTDRLRVTEAYVTTLERWIDDTNERLSPLNSFVLPGGTPAAAALHLARAVCRRVEIDVLKLAECAPVNPQVAIYLNRLSDYLFVLARAANDDGNTDVLWKPGRQTNDVSSAKGAGVCDPEAESFEI